MTSSAVASVLLPRSGGRLQDVVNPEDHLGGLGGLHQHLPLHAETLGDAQLGHASDLALVLKTNVRQNLTNLKRKL